MKRLFDIIVSLISIIIFLPFAIPIIIILKFTGEGEIFYFQKRVGKDQEVFNLFKFATMLKDSPNIGNGEFTVENDPRVLPFGKFLRKTKLNEVPQLLNILFGDMSIVGPRPQTPKYFSLYPEKDREVLCSVRPGLTGVASIAFRDEETLCKESDSRTAAEIHAEEIIPIKIKLERWYVANRTFTLDLKLIIMTALVVLFPSKNMFKSTYDLIINENEN